MDPERDVGPWVVRSELQELGHQNGAVVIVESTVEHEDALVEQGTSMPGVEGWDGR